MRAIIVFFDSLNKMFLPPYNSGATTIAPNFTRLAENSCKFNNSYVGSMPCMPARRELHTGRYNFLHREWGPLEVYDDSMPEILRNAGIYTHLISDHLHYWEDGGANYHTRYSSWEIVRGQEGDHWKGHVKPPFIPEVVKVPRQQTGVKESSLWKYDWVNREYIKTDDDYPQARCFKKACEFITQNKDDDNWLLHLETFDPHEPFNVPDKYLDLYPESYGGKHFDWPRGKVEEKEDEIEHCIRNYRALVSMCDYNLGKILDLMNHYNMWKDTLLIVGTDHGFLLANHGYWGKNQMPYYNEIANTPLFVWDPRVGVKGEERESLVQMIDWAPTLLEYFGQHVPVDMQGKDLKRVLEKDEEIRKFALFGVFSGHVNITDGRYVYMKGANVEQKDEVYNYTLIPQRMTKRFDVEELANASLCAPFSFTKQCPLLRIKAKEKYAVAQFGDLLFDLKMDPNQESVLHDEGVVKYMKSALLEKMKECDAPPEQYERIGLTEGVYKK